MKTSTVSIAKSSGSLASIKINRDCSKLKIVASTTEKLDAIAEKITVTAKFTKPESPSDTIIETWTLADLIKFGALRGEFIKSKLPGGLGTPYSHYFTILLTEQGNVLLNDDAFIDLEFKIKTTLVEAVSFEIMEYRSQTNSSSLLFYAKEAVLADSTVSRPVQDYPVLFVPKDKISNIVYRLANGNFINLTDSLKKLKELEQEITSVGNLEIVSKDNYVLYHEGIKVNQIDLSVDVATDFYFVSKLSYLA